MVREFIVAAGLMLIQQAGLSNDAATAELSVEKKARAMENRMQMRAQLADQKDVCRREMTHSFRAMMERASEQIRKIAAEEMEQAASRRKN